jgi:hypothetical protein
LAAPFQPMERIPWIPLSDVPSGSVPAPTSERHDPDVFNTGGGYLNGVEVQSLSGARQLPESTETQNHPSKVGAPPRPSKREAASRLPASEERSSPARSDLPVTPLAGDHPVPPVDLGRALRAAVVGTTIPTEPPLQSGRTNQYPKTPKPVPLDQGLPGLADGLPGDVFAAGPSGEPVASSTVHTHSGVVRSDPAPASQSFPVPNAYGPVVPDLAMRLRAAVLVGGRPITPDSTDQSVEGSAPAGATTGLPYAMPGAGLRVASVAARANSRRPSLAPLIDELPSHGEGVDKTGSASPTPSGFTTATPTIFMAPDPSLTSSRTAGHPYLVHKPGPPESLAKSAPSLDQVQGLVDSRISAEMTRLERQLSARGSEGISRAEVTGDEMVRRLMDRMNTLSAADRFRRGRIR